MAIASKRAVLYVTHVHFFAKKSPNTGSMTSNIFLTLLYCATVRFLVFYCEGYDGSSRQQTGGFYSSNGFEFRGSDPFAEFFKMHTGFGTLIDAFL